MDLTSVWASVLVRWKRRQCKKRCKTDLTCLSWSLHSPSVMWCFPAPSPTSIVHSWGRTMYCSGAFQQSCSTRLPSRPDNNNVSWVTRRCPQGWGWRRCCSEECGGHWVRDVKIPALSENQTPPLEQEPHVILPPRIKHIWLKLGEN